MIKTIVVDDHPLFRKGIIATFNESNQDIMITGEAGSGEEMFKKLEHEVPDIVLLDINLPGIGGVEIARRLKRDFPTVKILVVSSENATETIKEMIEAGVNGFISKRNSGTHELAKAIQSVVSGLDYFGRDISSIIFDIFVSKRKTTIVNNDFTEREKEIILACKDGMLCKEIAEKLGISANTVNTHKKHIFQKLGINNTMEMVQYAIKNGIIRLAILFLMFFFIGCHNKEIKIEKQTGNIVVDVDSLIDSTSNPELDSLLKLVTAANQDIALADLYFQIAEKYEDYNFEKAKEYYLKMRELCENLKYKQGIYQFSLGFAHILTREGLVDSAISINLKALEIAKEEKDELWTGKLSFGTANAYLVKQWYETALGYYMDALTIFENRNDNERLASIYFQLSLLYSDINVVDKAIKFGEKSIEFCDDDPYSFVGLAQAYSAVQQYDKSIAYMEEALRLSKIQNNVYLKGLIYYHLGEKFLMTYDWVKAEKYIRKALKINKEIGNDAAYYGSLALLSKVEELNGNFAQAEIYMKEVLQNMNETNNLMGKNFCFLVLSELSIAQNRYRDNIQYWKEWEIVKNEIAAETTLRVAGEMEAKFETAKKNLEIEQQKHIIARQKMQHQLLVGCVALFIIIVAFLWYVILLRDRRNKVLTETNAIKDKFFSIISHDLKNPAIVQRDAIELLKNNASGWNEDTIKEYYDELFKSAESYVALIHNLLHWAQMQTGRMSYLPTTLNLPTCLNTEIALIQEMVKNKDITFLVQLPDEAIVYADRNMICTVVRNLLTNAVKFTQSGGQVTLNISESTDETYTTNRTPQTAYRISVSDTGIGMSKAQIQNLLCPKRSQCKDVARQVSTKGTANETGSGLGLIVCKELIEKHGSTLHIDSAEGKGSTFWFEIRDLEQR